MLDCWSSVSANVIAPSLVSCANTCVPAQAANATAVINVFFIFISVISVVVFLFVHCSIRCAPHFGCLIVNGFTPASCCRQPFLSIFLSCSLFLLFRTPRWERFNVLFIQRRQESVNYFRKVFDVFFLWRFRSSHSMSRRLISFRSLFKAIRCAEPAPLPCFRSVLLSPPTDQP